MHLLPMLNGSVHNETKMKKNPPKHCTAILTVPGLGEFMRLHPPKRSEPTMVMMVLGWVWNENWKIIITTVRPRHLVMYVRTRSVRFANFLIQFSFNKRQTYNISHFSYGSLPLCVSVGPSFRGVTSSLPRRNGRESFRLGMSLVSAHACGWCYFS